MKTERAITVTITDRHPFPRRWGGIKALAERMRVGDSVDIEDASAAKSLRRTIDKLGYHACERAINGLGWRIWKGQAKSNVK